MDIPVWKIIIFISFVFLLEYAIYGADYYAEVFAEPPADDIEPNYIIVKSEVPDRRANSTYVRIYTGGNDPTPYYGQIMSADTVEKTIAKESVWSGFWAPTHDVYILTPDEVMTLKLNINELPSYGLKSSSFWENLGSVEIIKQFTEQVTQFFAIVWKILSFDIPNLPPLFRTVICFPIWTGLVLAFFQLIRGA